ncbi:hypothetical protein [Streptomyces sp. NPDC056160]|uniref:hypothetical protein n=1 Tax=Streptomyces sp. NPDC056160 TaxID=3345731 RepID=UPI0035D69F4D
MGQVVVHPAAVSASVMTARSSSVKGRVLSHSLWGSQPNGAATLCPPASAPGDNPSRTDHNLKI